MSQLPFLHFVLTYNFSFLLDLTIGQDFDSIRSYEHSTKRTPHAVMSYASLLNLANTSTALTVPVDYGSGTQWASGLIDSFPDAFLQLGLYIVGMCKDISKGNMDMDIDALAYYIKGLPTEVFLRIGYEFDSDQNNYDTKEYIDAFRHIVDRFRLLGVDKVAFVWHATGIAPRDGLSVKEWFPGEDYVDWCGISLFQQPYSCQVKSDCLLKYAEQVDHLCRGEFGLPVMVAESTPFGGIIDEERSDEGPNRAGYTGSSWSTWFTPVIEFIESHEVKMWSYIDCNWDAQKQWDRERAPGVHWGDSRVQHFPQVFERWKDEVADKERYSWSVKKVDASLSTSSPSPGGGSGSGVVDYDPLDSRHKPLRGINPTSKGSVCLVEDITRDINYHQWKSLLIGVAVASIFIAGAVGVFYREYKQHLSNDYVTIP